MGQSIIPNLWFDHQAEDAATFYTSLFDNSRITAVSRFHEEGSEAHGQPPDSVSVVEFELSGYKMTALNGGPHFTFTPAISFFVICETEEEIDNLWHKLSEGGETLQPLDRYDWSEKYGWVKDRYGLTWQLSLGDIGDVGQKITPALIFTGDRTKGAETAMSYYTTVFDNSDVDGILYHGPEAGELEGGVLHAQFSLNGEMFMVMDFPPEPGMTINEAISFAVPCASQKEVDYYWEKLTYDGDPKARQCGWCKDQFGVSWQIVPEVLPEMLQDPDPEKVKRVTKAFLQMKKFDIFALEKAYRGDTEPAA